MFKKGKPIQNSTCMPTNYRIKADLRPKEINYYNFDKLCSTQIQFVFLPIHFILLFIQFHAPSKEKRDPGTSLHVYKKIVFVINTLLYVLCLGIHESFVYISNI